MSSLAWVDFDEAERQRAQRIMALFQERDTRDELGLGGVRDSIADHLFPGTSTIQTRLRYMLFIPWIFQLAGNRDGPPDELMRHARRLEIRLTDALQAGGETGGIFGLQAGARLKRLPSSVYWAGLGAWGIRLFPGSIESYFASLRSVARSQLRVTPEEEHSVMVARTQGFWSPTLPSPPEEWLDQVKFQLTTDEAQYIIDRLIARQPTALLTALARRTIDADCTFIWEHPYLAEFPSDARRLVRHGEIFSHVMHGASLLYNLQLSELREHDDWVDHYSNRLKEWSADLDVSAVSGWSLDDFWMAIEHPSHTIRPAAKRFIRQWVDLVVDNGTGVIASRHARQLVEDRERRLKAGQSRFSNQAMRDRWAGASAAERLSFRWPQARSHLRDLANAE